MCACLHLSFILDAHALVHCQYRSLSFHEQKNWAFSGTTISFSPLAIFLAATSPRPPVPSFGVNVTASCTNPPPAISHDTSAVYVSAPSSFSPFLDETGPRAQTRMLCLVDTRNLPGFRECRAWQPTGGGARATSEYPYTASIADMPNSAIVFITDSPI